MDTVSYTAIIMNELSQTLSAINPEDAQRLISAILGSSKLFVAGAGRSGLAVRAFAMRLMHMGFPAYVVGETVTPALESGDLLLVASGSGETESLAVITRKAKKIGASAALITTRPISTTAKLSDIVVQIPAPTPKADAGAQFYSVQPMGSLFEQSLFMFLDAVVMQLMEMRGTDSCAMFSRHANLE